MQKYNKARAYSANKQQYNSSMLAYIISTNYANAVNALTNATNFARAINVANKLVAHVAKMHNLTVHSSVSSDSIVFITQYC